MNRFEAVDAIDRIALADARCMTLQTKEIRKTDMVELQAICDAIGKRNLARYLVEATRREIRRINREAE